MDTLRAARAESTQLLIAAALLLLGATQSGCRLPGSPDPSAQASAETDAPLAEPAAVAGGVTPVSATEHQAPDEEALTKVMSELRGIGAIDPSAEAELRNELAAADPTLYPLIVRQFRAALAYRQQLAEREQEKPSSESTLLAAHRQTRPTEEPPAARAAVATDTPVEPVRVARSSHEALPAMKAVPPMNNVPPSKKIMAQNTPGTVLPPPARAAAPTPPRDPLVAAIESMQSVASAEPSTADEVAHHMRLRLLQLVAGQDDAAFRPIPGATASQHDYWASQLFALQTYLDAAAQPNAKQRASATLLHLDEARSRLSELATLRLRNLSLVESVNGFGDYTPDARTGFKPGEQVTLYTELENFRSESTEAGYSTSLGTSYEVLDASGRRVDGGQFPDVDDVCRNRRQDFHLQYSVPLPTRIYPGSYRLKLVITDNLSNKLGQSELEFEIVE